MQTNQNIITINDITVIPLSFSLFIVIGMVWWTAHKMVKSHKNS